VRITSSVPKILRGARKLESRSPKWPSDVTQGHQKWHGSIERLWFLAFRSTVTGHILHRFRDTTTYWLKIAWITWSKLRPFWGSSVGYSTCQKLSAYEISSAYSFIHSIPKILRGIRNRKFLVSHLYLAPPFAWGDPVGILQSGLRWENYRLMGMRWKKFNGKFSRFDTIYQWV